MADLKSSLASGLASTLRSIAWIARLALRSLKAAVRIGVPWLAVAAERVAAAILAFWGALLDPDYVRAGHGRAALAQGAAARVAAQGQAGERAAAPPPRPSTPPPTLDKAPPDSALLLLGLFQKEGRLVDFLQEDVSQYSDADVGAAARVVHTGCRAVLAEYLPIAPIRDEPEGTHVTLEPGFDPSAVRPTGNVVGAPPFVGSLVHRGWRATQVRLPQVASGHDLRILAAAEVEL